MLANLDAEEKAQWKRDYSQYIGKKDQKMGACIVSLFA